MALAQHQRFEWPHAQNGTTTAKSLVLADDAQVQLQLQLRLIAQKAGMFLLLILPERRQPEREDLAAKHFAKSGSADEDCSRPSSRRDFRKSPRD